MGPPDHRHPPPFGEQSGMMAFRFGEDADAVGEGEGLSKVGESEHLLQPRNAIPLHQFPLRNLRPEFFYLRRGHPRGIAAASDALFARQTAHSRTSLARWPLGTFRLADLVIDTAPGSARAHEPTRARSR